MLSIEGIGMKKESSNQTKINYTFKKPAFSIARLPPSSRADIPSGE
jgi:hypothetical protein